MNNHYQLLEILQDCSIADIKKAYFRLVRKYPPDKEPERFMAIREAYEALSNEQTRLEYDKIFLLDSIARMYYQTGKEYYENRQYQKAVDLFKEAFKSYPHVTLLHEMYGDVLLLNGNSKTSVRVFEKLVENNPEHAGFLAKLANAQAQCGWWKKAYQSYSQALKIDRGNLSIWHGWITLLIDQQLDEMAYDALEEAIGIAAENNSDTISLMYKRFQLGYTLDKPHALLLDYIDQIIHMAEQMGPEEKENAGWFLHRMIQVIHEFEQLDFTKQLIERVKTIIPGESGKLDEILHHDREQQIIIPQYNQFISEEENNVEPLIFNHINFFLPPYRKGFHCFESIEDFNASMLISEYMLLLHCEECKQSLLYVKRKCPDIYDIFKDLFNTMQKPFEASKLAGSKFKRLQMDPKVMQTLLKLESGDSEPDDEEVYPIQLPYVRETPKTGRNDPCPCGSGKKYKKCCG